MAEKTAVSRTTVFLALAIGAIVLGGILIFVQVKINRSLKEEVAAEEQLLAQAQAQLARYQQLRDQAPAYREQLAALKRMIPAQPGEESIIREIYYLADDAKMRVTEIRFGTRVEKGEYVEMPLIVTLEGGYQGLLKTLSHIRAASRAIRVDDVRVNKQDGSTGVRVIISTNVFHKEGGQ